MNLAAKDIASEITHSAHAGKPELRCKFCPRVKAFKSIIALWSHFVHQHHKSSTEEHIWSKVVIDERYLLQEICRTAGLWRSYWNEYSDGGKRRDPTMMKLNQVAEDDFCMRTVLDWKLY